MAIFNSKLLVYVGLYWLTVADSSSLSAKWLSLSGGIGRGVNDTCWQNRGEMVMKWWFRLWLNGFMIIKTHEQNIIK